MSSDWLKSTYTGALGIYEHVAFVEMQSINVFSDAHSPTFGITSSAACAFGCNHKSVVNEAACMHAYGVVMRLVRASCSDALVVN